MIAEENVVTFHTSTASLTIFPAASRSRDIRTAAETLYRTHGEAAALYWKSLVRSIADPLIAMGIPDEDVRREIFAFQASVQAELQSISGPESAQSLT